MNSSLVLSLLLRLDRRNASLSRGRRLLRHLLVLDLEARNFFHFTRSLNNFLGVRRLEQVLYDYLMV